MMEKSFDGEGMPPAKSGDSLKRVTLRLPGGLLENYEAIAQRRGVFDSLNPRLKSNEHS
jgi:hypothetical protein